MMYYQSVRWSERFVGVGDEPANVRRDCQRLWVLRGADEAGVEVEWDLLAVIRPDHGRLAHAGAESLAVWTLWAPSVHPKTVCHMNPLDHLPQLWSVWSAEVIR
eukprot:COSAG01_NODE_47073_length_394_cov_0.525424_1_plen_104_part_00